MPQSKNGHNKHVNGTQQYWDKVIMPAEKTPEQDLTNPDVLQAWKNLLQVWLPATPADILDVGCGSGSLSISMAELGYHVLGIDNDPEMVAKALMQARTADVAASFYVMDATEMTLSRKKFDAVVCRHLLGQLSNIKSVLHHWENMLEENGRLLIIEGQWQADTGLTSKDILAALPPSLTHVTVHQLSSQAALWGKAIHDERFMIVAARED